MGLKVKLNFDILTTKDKWIVFILSPILLISLAFIIEKQVRVVIFKNNTQKTIYELAAQIEASNYDIAFNNIKALTSLNYVINTVNGKTPFDNNETLAALSTIREASLAEMVYLMNLKGDVVACTPDRISKQTFTGKNFSFRPYFAEVIKNNTHIYYPAVGVVSNKRGLYLGAPISDSTNAIIGVAVIKTGIEQIEDKLLAQGIPVAIASPDGIIYASNNKSWLFNAIKELPESKINELYRSKQFAYHSINTLKYDISNKNVTLNNTEYSIAKHNVFTNNWKVVGLFKTPPFNYWVFTICFVSLMVFLSGFYFAFQISNKLKKVNQLTKKQNEYSNRIFKHQEAIIHLNKSQIQLKNWAEVRGIITEIAANVLNVERSSIWLFNEIGDQLVCVDRYIKSKNEHENGQIITESLEPEYFNTLRNEHSIVLDKVTDVSFLSGLKSTIFDKKNINSIIHIPILQQGKPVGVMCLEQVAKVKHWNRDERIFAERLANRVSLFLVIQERRNTAKELKKSNEDLKLALEEAKRSKELEKANATLLNTLEKLKETQSQLIQSEKMASLGILTAGIAHEINNPLNFIQGGKTALELHVNDNFKNNEQEFKPMFKMIEQGISRATEIIKSLNHFNRSSEETTEICSLHAILENCLVMLHNQLKHKIEITKDFTSEKFCLTGNEGKLHQVFLNIIANAEQSIPTNGKIKIKTVLNGSYIKTIVSDNGEGIKEEHLHKIMDPFFTTKAPGKGTGLGLSIAHNIVQEHNGLIEYESKPQKGTTVTISLPLN